MCGRGGGVSAYSASPAPVDTNTVRRARTPLSWSGNSTSRAPDPTTEAAKEAGPYNAPVSPTLIGVLFARLGKLAMQIDLLSRGGWEVRALRT